MQIQSIFLKWWGGVYANTCGKFNKPDRGKDLALMDNIVPLSSMVS